MHYHAFFSTILTICLGLGAVQTQGCSSKDDLFVHSVPPSRRVLPEDMLATRVAMRPLLIDFDIDANVNDHRTHNLRRHLDELDNPEFRDRMVQNPQELVDVFGLVLERLYYLAQNQHRDIVIDILRGWLTIVSMAVSKGMLDHARAEGLRHLAQIVFEQLDITRPDAIRPIRATATAAAARATPCAIRRGPQIGELGDGAFRAIPAGEAVRIAPARAGNLPLFAADIGDNFTVLLHPIGHVPDQENLAAEPNCGDRSSASTVQSTESPNSTCSETRLPSASSPSPEIESTSRSSASPRLGAASHDHSTIQARAQSAPIDIQDMPDLETIPFDYHHINQLAFAADIVGSFTQSPELMEQRRRDILRQLQRAHPIQLAAPNAWAHLQEERQRHGLAARDGRMLEETRATIDELVGRAGSLTREQAKKIKKDFKKNARRARIDQLHDGIVVFTYDVPNHVPGTFTRWEYYIGSDGHSRRIQHITFDQAGHIIHIITKYERRDGGSEKKEGKEK